MTVTALQKAQLIAWMTGESIDRIRLYPDEVKYDEKQLQEYLYRVEAGESVGRITGRRWFWKNEFFIDGVLEPRADSETLVEAVLATFPDKTAGLNILDIGTGSGCLILSLLQEYVNAKGTAIDLSDEALSTAQHNADSLGLSCRFLQMNFTKELPAEDFDLAISNPPYIKSIDIATLENTVRDFDPPAALDGGEDGLDAYRAILEKARAPHLLFEIGQGQEDDIIAIAGLNGYKLASLHKDLGGITRVLGFLLHD